MSDQKTKPVKVPANQAELLLKYKMAFKKLPHKTLPEILKLRERFKARGMVI